MESLEKTTLEQLRDVESWMDEHKTKHNTLKNRMIHTWVVMIMVLCITVFLYLKTDFLNTSVAVGVFIVWCLVFRILYVKIFTDIRVNLAALSITWSMKDSILSQELNIKENNTFKEFQEYIKNC